MAERVDDRDGSVADELQVARPPVDQVRMAATRARAEQLLFGTAEPARIGRYVLLGGQADGGMGVVYAAYDPELHRKVALKVLHPRRQSDDAAHERLIAEARALARLDHPNVVKVHDVISHGDQVVIVMEWVEGTTLAAWEHKRRSWRDLVAIYVQAGHGLAAAHDVGVVHRDFKPANAIVGNDGRVRVLDFGLASPATTNGEHAAAPAGRMAVGSSDNAWAADVTATGDVVGTLAYAAPEQLAGEPATPASDQFSFAVALHRALEGMPPFAGDNASDLLRSIRSRQITLATDPRAVPAWLRSALHRALAPTPDARFPSLTALLAELTRPRGWRRWRIPAALSACTAAVAVAILTRPGTADPLAACDGGTTEIAAVWNPVARAQLHTSLDALATPVARDARDRVLRGLDGYRDRWTAQHRDACVAHRRGQQSAALLDRRMLCLQHRLGDLRASIGILQQFDAASASKATDVVARMPSPTDCGELERLQADVEPPSPTQRPAVDAVRAQLSQAAALDRAGRSAEALAAATAALAAAERTGYPPAVAEAALLRGRIFISQRNMKAAASALSDVRIIALQHRQYAIAVEAGAREMYAQALAETDGSERASLDAAMRDAAILLPLSEGMPGTHFARALLLNDLGSVAMAAGDRERATRYFEDAHKALDAAEPDLELVLIDKNRAMVSRDAKTREDLARGVWIRLQRELGEANLLTLESLDGYARYVAEASRAFPLIGQLCDDYDQFHPEMVRERVCCRSYQAFLAGELDDHDRERQLYELAVSIGAGSTNEDVVMWSELASGYAAFLRGDHGGAAAAWQPIVDRYGNSPVWWIQLYAAPAELGLGLSAYARGADRDAARHLGRAIATYRKAMALNENSDFRLRLARAERALEEIKQRASDPAARAP
jgi:tetratricopeptide (TPR) repeat protein/predicted Ser/Thr protein kinase